MKKYILIALVCALNILNVNAQALGYYEDPAMPEDVITSIYKNDKQITSIKGDVLYAIYVSLPENTRKNLEVEFIKFLQNVPKKGFYCGIKYEFKGEFDDELYLYFKDYKIKVSGYESRESFIRIIEYK